MEKFIKVILQAALAFVFLFIISKILGKKQVAQLDFTDYVIGISIGSIAAEMAVQDEIPFYYFLVAMFLFGFFDFLITIVSRKARFFKSLFKGRPIILIAKGEVVYENLKKSKLDIDELIAQCRNKGYFNISDICYCVFETSGDFSILPNSSAKQVTASDFNLPEEEVSLPLELVIDGKIIKKDLIQINKTQEWLLSKLGVQTVKDVQGIIIATYDEGTDKLNIQYKNTEASDRLAGK